MSDTIRLPLSVATRLCAELDASENADTPESNKAERMAFSGEYMVPTTVARKLERERAQAQEDLAELCKRYNELLGIKKEPKWYNGREIPTAVEEAAK